MNPYGLDFQPGERVRLDRDGSLPITGRVLSANPVGITLLAYDDGKPSPFPNRDDPPPVMIVWAAVSHVWLLDRTTVGAPVPAPLVPKWHRTEEGLWGPVEPVRTEWGGGAPPKAPDYIPDPEPSFHEAFKAEVGKMKEAGTLYGEAKIPWKDR